MSCTLCPLHRDALNVCIGGRGEGAILVVGQNPGGEENLAGQPFVGKSGQLLDAMLADAGYAPGDVRYTNAVRCATPENRAPFPAEIEACSVHLAAEIAERQPHAIIALGDIAFKALTGLRSNISSNRGKAEELSASMKEKIRRGKA